MQQGFLLRRSAATAHLPAGLSDGGIPRLKGIDDGVQRDQHVRRGEPVACASPGPLPPQIETGERRR